MPNGLRLRRGVDGVAARDELVPRPSRQRRSAFSIPGHGSRAAAPSEAEPLGNARAISQAGSSRRCGDVAPWLRPKATAACSGSAARSPALHEDRAWIRSRTKSGATEEAAAVSPLSRLGSATRDCVAQRGGRAVGSPKSRAGDASPQGPRRSPRSGRTSARRRSSTRPRPRRVADRLARARARERRRGSHVDQRHRRPHASRTRPDRVAPTSAPCRPRYV